MNKNISKSVIKRLPRYYRFLCELEEQGCDRVSSGKLSEIMRTTASQVRQDLNHFGGFGHQGYGYSVPRLKDEIINILGLNNTHDAVLIGAGHIGTGIAAHMKFENMGFRIAGIFDSNDKIIGDTINSIPISDIKTINDFTVGRDIKAAFLCIPKDAAPEVVKNLYNLGIRSFWNFTHYDIHADYPDAIVENVHLSDMLMTLCYSMNEQED
ncbi:MAG: redox-sensing transcriptional repressor Rex [Ruminococcus sp.]|jgi:redox-sensing transcriptional repressor|nr:redox-sensing transcriptional repressor Rex [Ruminococcus sp.]